MKKSHFLKAVKRYHLFFAGFLALFFLTSSGTNNKYQKNSLTIMVHGIHDVVSTQWIDKGTVLSSATERYIIVQDEATVRYAHMATVDEFTVNTEHPTPSYSSPYSKLVPADHIIYFNPKDARSIEKLREIGAKPNASVFIDMSLGLSDLSFRKEQWSPQTDWAASAAVVLAKSHAKEWENNSDVTLYGHSAGTEAVGKAQQLTNNPDKGETPPFKSIVASPRTKDETMFPDKKNTTVIFADGDYYYSPAGKLSREDITTHIGKNDAIEFSKVGYKVIRVVTGDESPQLNIPISLSVNSAATFAAMAATNGVIAWGDHTITNDLPNKNLKMIAYAPGTAEEYPVSNVPLGKLISVFSRSDASDISSATHSSGVKAMITDIQKNEPTDNIGGISLNAVASIPLDPHEIRIAGYNFYTKKLFLVTNKNDTVSFPYLDPETLHLSYECAYQKEAKPELSIGASPLKKDGHALIRLSPASQSPVYYLGETENTYLGLVMYLADKAIGELTFGRDYENIRSISNEIPGFHCLPELFPLKYATNPAQVKYLSSERVFLATGPVNLILNEANNRLLFSNRIKFEINFGKGGVAENYFTAFFDAHFNEILNTQNGLAFKTLMPYAKAVAIFRWLKTNNIPFDNNDILKVPVNFVYTPQYIALNKTPELSELSPLYPFTEFGVNGPLTINYTADNKTMITYSKGKVSRVSCSNGKTLQVYRDDIGNPIAWNTNDGNAGAFYFDPTRGPVYYKNIILEFSKRHVKAKLTNRSVVFPENQPDDLFQNVIAAFIKENQPI